MRRAPPAPMDTCMFMELVRIQIPTLWAVLTFLAKRLVCFPSSRLCVWGKTLDWWKVIECNQNVHKRAQRFALGVKNLVRRLLRWDGRHKWAGAPIQLTPRLPIPVRSHADSHGVFYLSLPLSTHVPLQYRINAAFHLVTLACHRLDWCSAEIC